MQNINYSGQYYNNHNYNIKIRTGEDILNATGDAICGEFMIAKGGQYPGLYVATKTSGDDFEIYRVSELIGESKLPINYDYSLKFIEDDQLDLNSTLVATGEFTFSFWFKPENKLEGFIWWGAGQYLTHYGPAYGNRLILNLGGQINSPTNSVIQGEWNHVFITRGSDGILKLILNGGSPLSSPTSDTDDLSISHLFKGTTSSTFFDGHIDEFAYWDSDQSQNFSEIYNNGNPADLSIYSPTHWWRMGEAENGSGSTIKDQGSGGNDLTINGATFSKDTPYNNSSLKFNGINNYLDTGSNFSETFSKAFTISLWFKGTTKIGENVYSYFSARDSSTTKDTLLWVMRVNTNLSIRYRTDKNQNHDLLMNFAFPEDNEWHHLVLRVHQVDNDTQMILTFDGVTSTSVIRPMNMSDFVNTANFGIGARIYDAGSGPPDSYLNGNIDEFSIFDRTLLNTEIAAIYNNGIPTSLHKHNPLHWWRMGENDSENPVTITDQGRGGINPAVIGTVDNSSDTPANSSPFSRYSLEFNGTSDSLSTGLSVGAKSALTVSAWVNMSTVQNSGFVQQYAAAGTNRTFRIIYAAGGFWFQCYTPEGITEATVTNASPATNEWIHLVGTFDGTTAKIYIDNVKGTDGATLTSTTLQSASSNVEIGGSSGLAMFTDGLIDEVAIWDVELANNERDYLYNNGKPGDISSLQPLGWWRMGDDNNGTGSTITDLGSGGNNGTINGASFSIDTPSK